MAKFVQTAAFAYGELLRRFGDILARPQTTLITCGYSFADDHINRLVVTALQNPTLQLVIYLPELEKGAPGVDGAFSEWVRRIISLNLPQVTLVGGGASAYVGALAADLPDPVLFDERVRDIRKAYDEFTRTDREAKA